MGGLGRRGRVHGGHEAFFKTKLIHDHFDDGGQAVGGARCVGDHGVLATIERLVVDFVHQGGHFFGALGGRGNQDPLGAAFVVLGSVSECGEEPGGLDDVIAAMVTPRKIRRITFADASGFLSVDREAVGMGFDVAFEHTVGGVVLQQIRQVV